MTNSRGSCLSPHILFAVFFLLPLSCSFLHAVAFLQPHAMQGLMAVCVVVLVAPFSMCMAALQLIPVTLCTLCNHWATPICFFWMQDVSYTLA